MPPRISSSSPRPLLLVGAALTAALAAAPAIDLLTADTIADHVRSAYPTWSAHDVALDRNAITGYLVTTGVLGVLGWVLTLRATRHPGRGRALTATMLALGVLVAATNLSAGGEQYAQFVPPVYAAAWVLPVAVGVAACVRVFRATRGAQRAARR